MCRSQPQSVESSENLVTYECDRNLGVRIYHSPPATEATPAQERSLLSGK